MNESCDFFICGECVIKNNIWGLGNCNSNCPLNDQSQIKNAFEILILVKRMFNEEQEIKNKNDLYNMSNQLTENMIKYYKKLRVVF